MGRDKTYSCNRCTKVFKDKKTLNKHHKEHGPATNASSSAIHRQSQDLNVHNICPYCQERFLRDIGLARHLRGNQECSAKHLRALAEPDWPETLPAGTPSDDLQPALNNNDHPMHDVNDVPAHLGLDEGLEDIECIIDTDGHTVYVERYPQATVGQPIRWVAEHDLPQMNHTDVGKLSKPDCFEVAQVLMESDMSGRYRERFLRLKRFKRCTPWKNNRAMLKDIDKLPHGTDWEVQTIEVSGDQGTETVEFWKRNPLDMLKSMLLDKKFKKHLHYAPERHYIDRQRKRRQRGEMWTGDLMWKMQDSINNPHATAIPYFVASDETTLSNFSGDKKAHPVYFSIGNLPKRLRLPKLDCETNEKTRRQTKRNLFHRCMEELLAPLVEASKVGVEVLCSDRGMRCIYLLLAAYIADYPEQCKIACTKQTYCPLCTVTPDARGDLGDSPLRDQDDVLWVMVEHEEVGSARYKNLGLFAVKPFWADHQFIDIGSLFVPDLLHQLNKGVFKDHLAKWTQHIMGERTIDERYVSMPQHHGIRHFKNGISAVSQWTGKELKEMAKVLLPVVSDANTRVVQAARALLDFMYLAHSSSLTDDELESMDQAIRTFHEHKEIFEQNGSVTTEKGFHGIPKIHMIQHYTHLIRQLGTPDGYNTETPERLHIDFAKAGYRASNKVNATKQMALYIQRREAIAMHAAHLAVAHPSYYGNMGNDDDEIDESGDEDDEDVDDEGDGESEEGDQRDADPEEEQYECDDCNVRVAPVVDLESFCGRSGGCWEKDIVEQPRGQPGRNMTEDQRVIFYPVPGYTHSKSLSLKGATGDYLIRCHHATNLLPAIRSFLSKSAPSFRNKPLSIHDYFPVWYRARLVHSPPPFKPSESPKIDIIRAQPAKLDRFQRVIRAAHFDTALALTHPQNSQIHKYTTVRVLAIFELPSHLRPAFSDKLVYVELFHAFSAKPLEHVGLFTALHCCTDGKRVSAVLPLSSIRMACHLVPRYSTFHPEERPTLGSDTLGEAKTFFLNSFGSYFMFELVRHWAQEGVENGSQVHANPFTSSETPDG
ncbi:hypothetical protein BDV93DRAFT_561399 [Ceratobasidium sp. AG-I]|nr:hypothetical protein BDV93DRAFT_561399 [Ceratobasidium sp. AG-I]